MVGFAIGTTIAAIAVIAAMVQRRRTVAAVHAVADRLDPAGVGELASLEWSLHRIERSMDASQREGALATTVTDMLQRALDRLPEGIVITDASGNEVATNAAARAMGGTHHGDAIVLDIVASLAAAARTGEARQRTMELVGPPRRSVLVRSMPFEVPGGSRFGSLVVVEDVTERQHLEEMRTDFVANVSHELKTPIGALALLAETLADETDPDVIRRLTSKMQFEAHRVGSLVSDLLELSRIETGEVPVQGLVRVRRVFAEAIERVRGMSEQRHITVERVDPPARLAVPGDRRQLVSAVGNLLENAVKYSDDGSVIELACNVSGSCIDIAVTDHGMGIPARDLDRVFERFYRVDRARSRETGGTGLGLAIVRHVAQNHHGSVVVESVEGHGSTFTLRLPMAAGSTNIDIAEAG